MADFTRSITYSYSTTNDMQIQPYRGPPLPPRPRDFRSYSTSSSSAYPQIDIWGGGGGVSDYYPEHTGQKNNKLGKSSSVSSSWGLGDPEFQRKKRVASYKMYGMEGKVKGSFRKSFRWIKNRYTQMVYGWW